MKYCWLDLESTGLKPGSNEIVEIAAIITNGLFDKIDEFHAVIKPSPNAIWQQEVVEMHARSGLLQEVLNSTVSVEAALADFTRMLKKHVDIKSKLKVVGNSVHFDTAFLKHLSPTFDQIFYSGHLDVSSIRSLVIEQYGKESRYPIKSNHRAMDDLVTCMAELDYYLVNFFRAADTINL